MKKKLLLMFLLLPFAAACATTSPAPKYPQLTAESLKKQCEPDERYDVPVLGVRTLFVRTNNCLGVKSLMVVLMANSDATEAIRDLSASLIVKHYLLWLESSEHAVEGKEWLAKQVKKENNEKDSQLVYYFILESKTTKQ